MIDDLQVDYIHYPHGIDHTNHKLPHSHLWDHIEWETIPFTELERRMYIRLMDEEHLQELLARGKAVRFNSKAILLINLRSSLRAYAFLEKTIVSSA